jgi:hypothetical protein
MNPYDILNIPLNSSIDDVKKAYKAIALKSHPDKLNGIQDINEKNKRIKEFMDATNAYNNIMNNDINFDEFDDINVNYDDWIETFNNIAQSKLFGEMINIFKKFKARVKKHNINVDIKYSDYFSINKKKLRIFLKNVSEPVYINLDCKKYPVHIINYYDDNDDEHEITINMIFINDININNGYYHIIEDDKINIHYDMQIDTIDYMIGDTKQLLFLNNEFIDIVIEPFTDNYIKKGFGINGGDLVINFKYNPINKEKWDKLISADKKEMIRIFLNIKMI